MGIIRNIKNLFHLFEAIIANIWFGFPSRKIKIIGVTGTDGKTTTTHLIHHLLVSSGHKASMISSIYAVIGGVEYETGLHTTTPRSLDIQKYLKKAVENGDEYFVLETTSHSLDQNRVWGVKYRISVLTNITREHLDYHNTYENYLKTKSELLKNSEIGIINYDDESRDLLDQYIDASKTRTFSLKQKADFNLPEHLPIRLKGEYNRQNILAAYAVCRQLGLNDKQIVAGLDTFKLPKGRLDVVHANDFKVIIDFAHTSNSIDKVLHTVRREYLEEGGRIIHVFGSAGKRDQQKRPFMGEASGRYADIIILTEEDYRTEDVDKICDAIAGGLVMSGFFQVTPSDLVKVADNKKVYIVETDRKKAIALAISIARPGDVVIATGKSHEKSLARGRTEYPWDEYRAVKEALANKFVARDKKTR